MQCIVACEMWAVPVQRVAALLGVTVVPVVHVAVSMQRPGQRSQRALVAAQQSVQAAIKGIDARCSVERINAMKSVQRGGGRRERQQPGAAARAWLCYRHTNFLQKYLLCTVSKCWRTVDHHKGSTRAGRCTGEDQAQGSPAVVLHPC